MSSQYRKIKYEEADNSWGSIKFPIVRNIQPTTLADQIEGIPPEDMPRRMVEMFSDVQKVAVETIEKKLEELRGTEGNEDRIAYLEDLLKKWKNG